MISIIMPVHNSLRVIETNLKNILPRIDLDDEIIVVDDKSNNPQKVRRLVSKFGARYFYINLKTNFNRGSAINKGASKSKNLWILELDQDKTPVKKDYFDNLQHNILAINNYRAVIFGHTKNHFPFKIKQKYISNTGKAKFNAAVGGNVCYSRRFFNEVRGYDTDFDGNKGFQDFDLFYRMQSNGGKLFYFKNMTTDHIDSHVKSHSIYKVNMDKFFAKHGFYPEVD